MNAKETNGMNPAAIYQAQFGCTPGQDDPRAACARWEKLCTELLADRDRLHQEKEHVQKERDTFRRSILALITKDIEPVAYTQQEMLEMVASQPTLKQVIDEIVQEGKA